MTEPLTSIPLGASLERVVVRTADGRTFDLGKPGTVEFRVRRRLMLWRRRKEIRNG